MPETDLLTIHEQARKNFDIDQSSQLEERRLSNEDRRFCSITGAQWEGSIGDTFENNLKLEVNKVQRSVNRIHDEYINNRIAVDFVSQDGSDANELADTCDGLLRADEQDSNANEAYDNAFDEGATGGFAAWRLRAVYENPDDDENEQQRILIEPIYEADTCVYFDAAARKQDKSDAKRCFVLTPMLVEDYKEEYDDDPATWPKDIESSEFDWVSNDFVYIAEYYKVEKVKEEIHIYKGIGEEEQRYSNEDLETDPEIETTLLATGFERVRTKKITRQKVRKYIMSGSRILEDCGYVAGRHIPIIPFYGKRWYIDGIERFSGHVRLAKDVQRLANVLRSKLGELAATGSQETPIFDPDQVNDFMQEWQNAHIDNPPLLRARALRDDNGNVVTAGPVGYTKAPEIPSALAALIATTEQDIKDILGDAQAGEQIVSNISGKAVEMIQKRLDMMAYIYLSNFAKAMKRSGEVWLGMAKELYIEPQRKMKTVTEQGKIGQVELNIPFIDEDLKESYQNDLSHSNLGLTVDVGPSSSSQKAATVTALTGMMQVTTDPEDMKVLSAATMMNMEGNGLDDIRDYYRQKLIRMGAVKPTKEEQAQLVEEAQNQKPDPNAVFLEQAAKKEEAQAGKAEADTIAALEKARKTEAETRKTEAETVDILSGISREERQIAIEAAEAIKPATAQPDQLGE
jgi:hypothetical protein